jgi:hypothetical protein
MTVKEVISYLTNEYKELSFTVFTGEYISYMIACDRESPASNCRMAVKHLHEYMSRDNIFFSDITPNVLRNRIDGMMNSSRKRNLHPDRIKTILRNCFDFILLSIICIIVIYRIKKRYTRMKITHYIAITLTCLVSEYQVKGISKKKEIFIFANIFQYKSVNIL